MDSKKNITKSKPYEFENLFNRIRKIHESKKNLDNIKFWNPKMRDHWVAIAPKTRKEIPFAPFMVEPEATLWGLMLGFSVKKYYTDPKTYLEAELKKTIFRFENFDDCTCAGKTIVIWLGVPFETTFFGLDAIYSDNENPWISKLPVIKNENDLDNLPPVNFYKSGQMPLAHRFYSEIKDMLPDDFDIIFPDWGRSPFSALWHIRGLENLLIDVYDRPDFVCKLLNRITVEREKWFKERANFLNNKVGPGIILNDEVGSPIISPKTYEEFILPSELELADFHGGISYWHSCGNTTDFIKLIRKIPGLKLFHVSPFTDLKTAVEEMGKNDIALQICLNPVTDIHMATKIEMKKKLKEIVKICGDVAYTIRVDGIQKIKSVDYEIKKLKDWIEVAKEVLP